MATGPKEDEPTLDLAEARKAGRLPDVSHVGKPIPAGDGTAPGLAVTSGRYRLGDQLGAGGMGVVYEARDGALDRVVAVKKLRPERASDLDLRDRFLREAWVMAQLDHPGVLPVYELGLTEDGTAYYAMKRVRGRTLRELLAARPEERLGSRDELLHLSNLFERATEAVAAAHVEGFAHRDLKPENVMVDRHGSVFVMDWGIARRVAGRRGPYASTQTELGVIIGSPAYMSPEQARGDSASAGFASDVFALGVILYEILTGETPFKADSIEETLKKVLELEPGDPKAINPSVPRELAAICVKALAKSEANRYPTASELAADLKNYRVQRPVSAAPPRPVDRALGLARRRPALAAATGVAILVAVVGVLAAVWLRVEEKRGEAREIAAAQEYGRQAKRYDDEAEALRKSAASAPPEERTAIEVRARALEARRELQLFIRRMHVWGALATSGGEPSDAVKALVREQVLLVTDRYIRDGRPEMAREIVTWARLDQAFRTTAAFSPEELDRLETEIAKAEAARTPAR